MWLHQFKEIVSQIGKDSLKLFIMKWRIYYGDGTTFDGSVEDAPGDNVQVIVQQSISHGRTIIAGGRDFRGGFYWWENDLGWNVGDNIGLILYLTRPGWKKVVFGQTILDETYREIYGQAVSDPDFPVKTGWDRGERPSWLTWESNGS